MFLLVDGSNLVHRALHSSFKNSGTYSYLEAIPKVLSILDSHVNYYLGSCGVILAWDSGLPLFRREIYSEYKPDSTPVGDFKPYHLSKVNLDPEASYRVHSSNKDLRKEYTKAVDILSKVIIPCCNSLSIKVDNCEADDIIAWICYHFPYMEKTIISSDKDLLQLLEENTDMYSFMTSTKYTWEWVCENYSFPDLFQYQYVLEKAILGDKSDNIPKVELVAKGTVKKYTTQILKEVEKGSNLKKALAKIERPERASKQGCENLKNSYDLIMTNMKLMDLYYPIETNEKFIHEIKNQLMVLRNFKPEYSESIERLDAIEGLPFTCGEIGGRLFHSNDAVDRFSGFLNEIK